MRGGKPINRVDSEQDKLSPSLFLKTRFLDGKQMRKIQFRSGYYYHIYNRGVNRQAIFFNDENWGYFMRRLRHYCTSELIEIIAYCLMPNHYHLLVYLKDNNLSTKVMQPLAVSYTKSVNRQQGRVGHISRRLPSKIIRQNRISSACHYLTSRL